MAKSKEDRDPDLVLVIADEDFYNAYLNYINLNRYSTETIFDFWDHKTEMSQGTTGPLNEDFVRRFITKSGSRYKVVVVSQECKDLIPAMREAGYKGKILEIMDHEAEAIFEKSELSDKAIGILPTIEDEFEERLNETLEKLLN